jgi:hypothetical protein
MFHRNYRNVALTFMLGWFVLGWGESNAFLADWQAWQLEPVVTTAYRRVTLHSGPGDTYRPNDVLNPGLPIQIIERNSIGNWLRVQRVTEDGTVAQDGWLMLGTLNITPEMHFGTIPINHILADAELSELDSRSMRALYAVPVIPQLSAAMVAVFEQGQGHGRNPQQITKVGDSLSADTNYLEPFSRDGAILGPFDYLAPTLDYYGDATVHPSVAARIGLSSLVVFDPFWADKALCEPNESPLDCEYRLTNPSIAFIMFGPNDVLSMDADTYHDNMRAIIESTLQQGIIPVLSTFSYHPEHEYWLQSVELNLQLVELADEYQLPLMNLWAASRPLPDYGLDRDRIHMLQSGFATLKYDSGHETWYGTSLRNLLALRTLDEIRLTLGLEK